MTIKKLGYSLIGLGGIFIAFSLLVDILEFGDDGIQAAQLLGILVGVFFFLVGIGLTVAWWNNDIRLTFNLSILVSKILDFPVFVWVLITFIAVYILIFISYMFLDPDFQMNYMTKYLPNAGRVGLDIRVTMQYIEEWLVLKQSPYETGFIVYPPLTLILFAPLLLIGYPAYFKLITFITLFGYVIVTLFIPLALNKSKGDLIIPLIFVIGLFSYGLQFEIERGQSNMIAFALCMASIYLFHAHPKLRFFAYILFTLAVQLKIYPAIFIIMMIDNWRDWKINFMRLAGISLLNFALLFVLGFDLFWDFLSATISQQSQLTTWNGISIRSFIFVLSETGYSLFPESIILAFGQYSREFELLFMALFFVCIITLIVLTFIRQENGFNPFLFLACTVGALIIPTISNDYKLPLLIAPISILFSNWPDMVVTWKKVVSIAALLIISTGFWSTFYPFKYKPEILHNSMPVLLLILLLATLIKLITLGIRSVHPVNPIKKNNELSP